MNFWPELENLPVTTESNHEPSDNTQEANDTGLSHKAYIYHRVFY